MYHFESVIIPAGAWSRLHGTTAKGGDNEPRPHIIPLTPEAERFIEIDSTGFLGRTGLCPGRVTYNGRELTAYRFITLTDADARHLIDQLEDLLKEMRRA